MKHFIRDIIIFLFSISGISYLYRLRRLKQGPLVRVIAFHDVSDKQWFENVIKMIKDNFNIITPEQFHDKNFHNQKINILLTFDDGYQSWIDNCLPVLEKYNCKGLFFINSGLLDIAHDEKAVIHFMHDRLFLTPKKPLTWKGAKVLVENGHAIGGHTVTHPSLAKLEIDEIQREVAKDREQIENKLDIILQDFAYPYGTIQDYQEKIISEVQAIGYTFQYSAVSNFNISPHRAIISRTLLEKNQPIKKISFWIKGGYDIFTKFMQKN